MTALLLLTGLVALSVISPFLGTDTRRTETTRRQGSFIL